MPIPSALPRGTALFTFHGRVVRVKRLGSRLGFPTANIAYDPQSRAWPREGVYVGVARLDGESRGYVCIINQGRHPTVPEGMATVEAHLLGHEHRAVRVMRLSSPMRMYPFSRRRFMAKLTDGLVTPRCAAMSTDRAEPRSSQNINMVSR